jgi:predicted DNA-binding protein with PD1-like motif
MRFSRFGTTFILRIDRGEEIVAALKTFCTEQKIALATVQGIGAVDNAVIGLFEAATQRFLPATTGIARGSVEFGSH